MKERKVCNIGDSAHQATEIHRSGLLPAVASESLVRAATANGLAQYRGAIRK